MRRFVLPLSIFAGLLLVAFVARGLWLPQGTPHEESHAADDAKTQGDKIIVGDAAQKNLKITAKSLKADTFWKTISVQGMVVERPGISDREIAAPATGIVSEILHVPGDTVRPGDTLFKLKLASEALQQTQTDLFKASQDIKLAEAKRKRLAAAGESIAQSRLTEIESEISRLQAAAKAYRQELANRGLTSYEIESISDGNLLSEISVTVPERIAGQGPLATVAASNVPLAFEVQQLQVELGEQVQAGQTLCHLSNHRLLAIEGRAFRDETTLLEHSIKESWPVEVDFQELAGGDWDPLAQTFTIRYLANTIDPVTRTFSFLLPLENQSKTIEQAGKTQLLWRFRPGQKVRLQIRTEKLDDVFILPADAVVFEGADAYVFTQNVNTFERKPVHVLFRDRDHVVVANDTALPTYKKGEERWTIPAVVRVAAAQLNRMSKAGSSTAPKGFHIHADGSLHKNEDESK